VHLAKKICRDLGVFPIRLRPNHSLHRDVVEWDIQKIIRIAEQTH
jgi:hypothetical protein